MYDFLLVASFVVFGFACFIYLRHPAACLVHPVTIYLAFHGFVFVIRPVFARIFDFQLVYRVYGFQPSLDDKITVILGANLAMLVFVAVGLMVAPRPVAPIPEGEFQRARAALTTPFFLAGALLLPLAVWSQLQSWQSRVTNYANMAVDQATGIQVNLGSNGWFSDSAHFLAPLAVLALWLSRYRWWGWAFFAAAGVLLLGSGVRGAFIFSAAAVAMIFMLEKRREWFDWRAIVIGVVALFAFNAVVADRGAGLRQMVGGERGNYSAANYDLAPLEHMDFANMEYFEFAVYAVPQRTGTWDYFAHNLQIFTEPIPRALWKDKPVGSPVQFFKFWDYGSPVGMTISLPGAGWMSLGYLGIVVQASLFALIYGAAYRLLLMRGLGAFAGLGYALLMATSVLVFRDGVLLTLLRLLPFLVGPFLLILLIARVNHFMPWMPGRAAMPGAELLPEGAEDLTPAERRKALAGQPGMGRVHRRGG